MQCGITSEESAEGWDAMQQPGNKPVRSIILIADEIIIICDGLLIRETMEKADDKRYQGN